ncbi:MAG: hypothetical protein GX269_06755 [Clostridiales bacterium]|nr:hypothetical protein [Clostridiales bacterium]
MPFLAVVGTVKTSVAFSPFEFVTGSPVASVTSTIVVCTSTFGLVVVLSDLLLSEFLSLPQALNSTIVVKMIVSSFVFFIVIAPFVCGKLY